MKRRILIIDDSTLDQLLLENILADEYDIFKISNGKDGLKLLKEKYRYLSLVILDIVMPEMNGFQVLQEIRKNVLFYQIPVLMITSLEDDETKEKAIVLGANGFISKPYNRIILKYTISNLIKLKETSALANMLKKDRLTSLLNKETFFQDAQRMINSHSSNYFILSSIDINKFKIINDQYGRSIGDEILVHTANCLKEFIDSVEGIAGRISEDKFAVLYPGIYKDSNKLRNNHEKIQMQSCFNGEMRIRIGRYYVNDLSIPVETMFDRAVVAEEFIRNNTDTYIIDYNESMRESILREQSIINDMESALENKEFIINIQPQYNNSTNALIGGEALVRWKKNNTIIPPNDFIPIFEKNGFIYKLDQYVWNEVCKLLRKWIDNNINPLPISINISRVDFRYNDLINLLTNIINGYGIPYDMIRLEVTESALSEKKNTIVEKVNKLIELGFTVEIDDFGSGYSSLNTLKDVKAQILKLDMRFFEKTDYTDRGGNIIEAVVRMAKWLGMAVIAEGVEDQEYVDYLKSIGCYYIQGYYYSKPLFIEEYEKLLITDNKEVRLTRLETLKTLDNNDFWNPKSMDTLIFNSYIGGVCIFEYNNGKIELLRINKKYAEIVYPGASIQEVFKHTIINSMDEENRNSLLRAIQQAIKTEDEVVNETVETCMYNSEKKIYIRSTIRVIAHTENRYLLYSTIIDTTAQREAEQNRMMISEQMQAVLDGMSNGITATIIRDGIIKVIFFNERFYQMRGYTKEQYHNEVHNFLDLVYTDDKQKVQEATINEEAINRNRKVEYRFLKRDGTQRWCRVIVSSTKFLGYKENVTICTYIDITMEKEKEIQEKLLLDNLPCGAALFRYDGETLKVIHINKKYWDLVERNPVDYSNSSVFDAIHKDDKDSVFNEILLAIKENRNADSYCRILVANNQYKRFHVIANICKEENDHLLFVSYTLL